MKEALILVGPPACGKTTVLEVAQQMGMHPISMSGNLSKIITPEQKINMNAGFLVPDEIVVPEMKRCVRDLPAWQDIIWDGGVRTVTQANTAYEILIGEGYNIRTIHVDVSFEVARNRGKGRGRKDDEASVFEIRLKEYEDKTLPAIEVLRKMTFYHLIDNSQNDFGIGARRSFAQIYHPDDYQVIGGSEVFVGA